MTRPVQADYEQEFLVSSADVDFDQKLRLSSLTNYLIQVAWKHAEMLKWGIDDLKPYNLVWVLSGFQLEIDEYPIWRDNVTVKTWPKGINRLFYLRDFEVFNEEGKRIARATSNWILIDITSRRPKVHDLENEVFALNANRHAIEEPMQAIKFKGEVKQSKEFNASYSDIDLNQHVTTTKYIDWLCDTWSAKELKSCKAKRLSVAFKKEIPFNTKVVMQQSVAIDGNSYFQLESADSSTIHFVAELQ